MAVSRETVAGEVDVVADALGAIAVVAHAVEAARGVAAQAGGIDGGSNVAGPSQSGLNRWGHLVHPDDMYHVVRSPGDGGDTVATAVDVDDDAILSDGIGTGEEEVHVHRVEIALALFLVGDGFVTVDDLVMAAADEFGRQPHLADGLRAAPGDTATLGHERLDKGYSLGCGGTVMCVEVAALQVLDDATREQFVMDFDWCHDDYSFDYCLLRRLSTLDAIS